MDKIRAAFEMRAPDSPEDFPIIVNTPCYFAFGDSRKPVDYFSNPGTMVAYQERGFEQHLERVRDDTVPYFMPWYGTGVLASAFGGTVHWPESPGADPAVVDPCVNSPGDVAGIKQPDPDRDGLMPRVLATIDYAREHSDLPIGLTDMNSPLSTAAIMCGYDKLFYWMYDEPALVEDLLDIVCEAFVAWTKCQKEHIGEPLSRSNGLQGVWSPEGVGVWVSDDDLVSIGADLYKRYVVPAYSKVFQEFEGGSVHFCGNGAHQASNILRISAAKVVNNSPMGDFDSFEALYKAVHGSCLIQIQDCTPVDIENYYASLFERIADLRGVMLASFTMPDLGMNADGGYDSVTWDIFDTANRVVDSVRSCVAKKLGDGRYQGE
jgi:hypothetical protein